MNFFITQLEKARESADAANLRALYAETAVKALENDGAETTSTDTVKLTQKNNWEYIDDIAGVNPKTATGFPITGEVQVTVSTDGTATFATKE